jgi:hypothetical protein
MDIANARDATTRIETVHLSQAIPLVHATTVPYCELRVSPYQNL